jgi:hypothetical protein
VQVWEACPVEIAMFSFCWNRAFLSWLRGMIFHEKLKNALPKRNNKKKSGESPRVNAPRNFCLGWANNDEFSNYEKSGVRFEVGRNKK